MTVAVNKASIPPIRTIGGLRTGSRCPYTFKSILSDIERMFYIYIFFIFGEPRTGRHDRQPRPINRTPTTGCIPRVVQQAASKCVDSVARRVYCAMSILAMRRPCPPRKKLRNYLPGFVQSLLAKHNSLCNSRRQQYNSGVAHQPTHPHKPAAMCAIQHNIPHNHGK